MPTRRIEFVDQPYVGKRFTPEYGRLAGLYTGTAETLARIALQKGAATAGTLRDLGGLYSNYRGEKRDEAARLTAAAVRATERAAEAQERKEEREARAAERKADAEARKLEQDRGAARFALTETPAGPVNAVTAELLRRFPETAGYLSQQTTLPARVTPGAMGEVSPVGSEFAVKAPTDEQTARSQALGMQTKAAEAAALRAATDDERQSRMLSESIRHNRASEAISSQRAASAAATAAAAVVPDVNAPTNPASQDIMGHAGLTRNGFLALTNPTMLPRDQRTRNAASAEVAKWAAAKGIDTSTFASQFKGLNEVLQTNIERFNTVKNIEGELAGDVANLTKAAASAGLDDVRAINAAKLWLKGELNDPQAADYAFSLNALVSDLARYNATASGRSPLESDMAEAKATVQRGVAAGSLKGLEAALNRSVGNMDKVLTGSVDRASRGVWKLFGVEDKYRPAATGAAPGVKVLSIVPVK